jgi:nicotinamide mononucleotide adenylyltransferase
MRLTSTACLPSKAAANQIWWRWVKAHIQRFLNNQSANKLQQNCFVDHLLQSSVSTFYGRVRLSKQLIRTELQRYAHKFSNSRNQKVNITCCAPKDTIRSTRASNFLCIYTYIYFLQLVRQHHRKTSLPS